jgi:hypothetical protein
MTNENHVKTELDIAKFDLDKLKTDMVARCKARLKLINEELNKLHSEEERLEVILEDLNNNRFKS